MNEDGMSRGLLAARRSLLATSQPPTAHRRPPLPFPRGPFLPLPFREGYGEGRSHQLRGDDSTEQSRATRQTTVHQRHPTTSARAPASRAKVIANGDHLHPHIRGPSINGAGALRSLRAFRCSARKRVPVAAQLVGTTLPVPLPLRFAPREGRRQGALPFREGRRQSLRFATREGRRESHPSLDGGGDFGLRGR
jgi:hypothetical protein